MGTGDTTAAFCAEFVAGLADAGVSTAFVSPGSRNTPLTLAIINEPRIRDINVRDERAAGFMAVGHAKATGVPAIVACTSGSAATHYFPSIVEADQSSTPLIVVSADRPIRLRGTGAPQTMDQTDLFGSHAKQFIDTTATSLEGRTLGVDLVRKAIGRPPGAVHANLPFDEPLLPSEPANVPEPRPIDIPDAPPMASTGLLEHLSTMRTIIVASGRQRPGFERVLGEVAESMAAPVFVDPQTPVAGSTVLTHGDVLAGVHDDDGRRLALDGLEPEAVLRLGPLPTSKPLWTWFEEFEGLQVHVDDARVSDPFASRATQINADPLDFLNSEPSPQQADRGWVERWLALDAVAGAAMGDALDELEWPNEPRIAQAVGESVPEGSVLYLASSRPIRDVDAFACPRADVRVLSNRGVNGIDGTIASAAGAATSGMPTTLLIGDVAALHDATSLAEAVSLGVPLRIVVVNNDGGGIFEFLPQATSGVLDGKAFERHWGTPHGLSIATISGALGMPMRDISTADELERVVGDPPDGPELIEIPTDRARLVADHRRVRTAVAEALRRGKDVEERA